jgi:V8-like Glu-specific endopeptidase
VKLFLRFAGQQDGTSWAMATGWLIEPDLLVTAGHCANDWSHNYGKLTHVKAYIGYTGKEAVSEANQVQMRMGTKVATTESWLTKGNIDSRGDVSFISLNKPFTGVTPFKYIPTPMSGTNERIGVVGYPGDLMKRDTGEKGAVGHDEPYGCESICLLCAAHVRNVQSNHLRTGKQQVQNAAVYY